MTAAWPTPTREEPVRLRRRSSRLVRAQAVLPRWAFLATTALLAILGLRSLLLPAPVPLAPPAPRFAVDQAAQGFAVQFVRAYLTYRPEDGGGDAEAVDALAPSELAEGAGFSPPEEGRQRVSWVEPVQDQPSLAGGRIVTVVAETSNSPVPLYLAVPVVRTGRGVLSLGGYPSFVGAPAASREEPLPEHEKVKDPELVEVSGRAVANFLAGERDNLNADLTDDAVVALPTVKLDVEEVHSVEWADPAHRGVLVTVGARGKGESAHTLTYELGVSRQRDRWRVHAIEVDPLTT